LYVFTRARECAFKRLNEDSAMLSGGRDILNVTFLCTFYVYIEKLYVILCF